MRLISKLKTALQECSFLKKIMLPVKLVFTALCIFTLVSLMGKWVDMSENWQIFLMIGLSIYCSAFVAFVDIYKYERASIITIGVCGVAAFLIMVFGVVKLFFLQSLNVAFGWPLIAMGLVLIVIIFMFFLFLINPSNDIAE